MEAKGGKPTPMHGALQAPVESYASLEERHASWLKEKNEAVQAAQKSFPSGNMGWDATPSEIADGFELSRPTVFEDRKFRKPHGVL